MVLDGTVMNVSISTVVDDLDTTVDRDAGGDHLLHAHDGGAHAARREARRHLGSTPRASSSARSSTRSARCTTALSPNMGVLFLGWSIIEGLGAVLVIPAIAALIADNYEGHDRVTAFAVIGAVSGAAVAAGPLIGGFMTTYFSWRYVFVARGRDHGRSSCCSRAGSPRSASAQSIRIDLLSVLLSAVGLVVRRVRDAAEQDLGLDHAAALPRDQRRRDRAARDLADRMVRDRADRRCWAVLRAVSGSSWRRRARAAGARRPASDPCSCAAG